MLSDTLTVYPNFSRAVSNFLQELIIKRTAKMGLVKFKIPKISVRCPKNSFQIFSVCLTVWDSIVLRAASEFPAHHWKVLRIFIFPTRQGGRLSALCKPICTPCPCIETRFAKSGSCRVFSWKIHVGDKDTGIGMIAQTFDGECWAIHWKNGSATNQVKQRTFGLQRIYRKFAELLGDGKQ